MRKWLIAIFFVVVFLTYVTPAQAIWWFFGRQEDIPEIRTLYVGGVDIIATATKELTLDNSNLVDGEVVCKGFVRKAKAPLALAKISLDGGTNWEQVEITGESFIYKFKPVEDMQYKPQFIIIDTAGKESSAKDIPALALVYKNVGIDKMATWTLLEVIDAYTQENLEKFMGYVSQNFQGDSGALRDGVNTDFKNYDHVIMNISVVQQTKSGNQVNITFDFNWSGVKKSDGTYVNPARDTTTYTFIQEEGKYKIYKMGSPIIFGVSRASAIDTSSLASETEESATTLASQDAETALTIYTATISDHEWIDFSTQTVGTCGDVQYHAGGALALVCASGVYMNTNGMIKGTDLEDYTTVPADSDASWDPLGYSATGTCYIHAIKDAAGKYAIMDPTSGGGIESSVTVRYKYQPDGTRNVP